MGYYQDPYWRDWFPWSGKCILRGLDGFTKDLHLNVTEKHPPRVVTVPTCTMHGGGVYRPDEDPPMMRITERVFDLYEARAHCSAEYRERPVDQYELGRKAAQKEMREALGCG